MEIQKWIDAEAILPEKDGRYLCILKTGARANHAKTWAGMGEPEICTFCRQWSYPWNVRGTLEVAYWRELPTFDRTWQPNDEGEQGQWV